MVSKKKEKIGKVAFETRGDSIRFRFKYQNRAYVYTVGAFSKENWKLATALAKKLDSAIVLGTFEQEWAELTGKNSRSSAGKAPPAGNTSEMSLKEVWEAYKTAKVDKVAHSTKVIKWRPVDRVLDKLEPQIGVADGSRLYWDTANNIYAISSAKECAIAMSAAISWATKMGYVQSNPLADIIQANKNKNEVKKQIESFKPSEVSAIIGAFSSNEAMNANSPYEDSYYLEFVEFLFYTGCRPGDACALTWSDVKLRGKDDYVIVFNKSVVYGKLGTTKNKRTRIFPINNQLAHVLDRAKKRHPKSKLVFPARKGGYIDVKNFGTRVWQRVVKHLVATGKVETYLGLYHCRHTFITRLVRQGIDVATVAALVENSPEVIFTNYLSADKGYQLPEF